MSSKRRYLDRASNWLSIFSFFVFLSFFLYCFRAEISSIWLLYGALIFFKFFFSFSQERLDVKAFSSDGSYYKLSARLNMTSDRTKVGF